MWDDHNPSVYIMRASGRTREMIPPRRLRRPRPELSSKIVPFLILMKSLAASSTLLVVNANATLRGIRRRRRRMNNNYYYDQDKKQTTRMNECKTLNNVIQPGGSLSRGQFLCYGDLRLGIDIDRGYFLLGFINSTMDDENFDHVTPTLEAWRAVPNALFASSDQAFEWVGLTDDGNILGYDASGMEIYDSNYDYEHRLDSKAADSSLFISTNCWDLESMPEEEGCVELLSPNGIVTWTVVVSSNEDITEIEPLTLEPSFSPSMFPSSMPSVVDVSSTIPSLSVSPTILDGDTTNGDKIEEESLFYDVESASSVAVGNAIMSSEGASNPPASFPSYIPTNQNIFLEGDVADSPVESAKLQGIAINSSAVNATDVSAKLEDGNSTDVEDALSVIWGTVWLDSNRNGAMDIMEEPVDAFQVRLYECSQGDDGDVGNETRRRSLSDDGVVFTNPDGMFVFEVPIDRTYRVHFDVDHEVYGYSSGIHTSVNPLGWTGCDKLMPNNEIQWDAGLYLMNDTAFIDTTSHASPEMADAFVIAGDGSSIGGLVYLDVDEDRTMDPNERNSAVGGYTVNDASILVSLLDCNTNDTIQTSDMKFPGFYSFDGLTEGFYKLLYEMRVIVSLNATGVPMYSFVDGNNGTLYETTCGKLGKGEIIDSGNVGLRMEPLEITPYSSSDSIEDSSRQAAAMEEASNSGTIIPGLVGFFIALASVVFVAILFIKHSKRRYLDLKSIPFVGNGKSDIEDGRSDGSSRSFGSTGRSTQQKTSKSVAANDGEGNDSDDSDIETESYTGLKMKLSPFRKRGNSSEMIIGQINEAGSEGYEVYDDEEGSERSERSAVDYGPVVTDIIAKYSEKQSKAQHELEEEYLFGTDDRQRFVATTGESSRASDPPAASYKDIPGAHVGSYTDLLQMSDYHQYQTPDQYPSGDDSYQFTTIDDAPVPRHPDGEFDGIYRPIQYVSCTNREQKSQHESDDSDSSSSDSDSDFEGTFASPVRNSSSDGGSSTAKYEVDDVTTVLSSGSDQSSDPPGASYKSIPISSPLQCRTTPSMSLRDMSIRDTSPGFQRSPPKSSADTVRQVDPKLLQVPLHFSSPPTPLRRGREGGGENEARLEE